MQVVSLTSRYLSLAGPEYTAERLALATEAVRLAEDAGDHQSALIARVGRITELLELGEIADADAEIELHARLAEAQQQPASLWRASVFRAMRALLSGRFEEAEWLVARALDAGQRLQDPNVTDVFGVQMLTLRREQGRLGEMEAVHRNFLAQHPDHLGWRSAFALVLAEMGRKAEAEREFERVYATTLASVQPDLRWLPTVATLGEVCAVLGDAARAIKLYELLSPYPQRCIVVGYGAACLGSVSYYLGLLARTTGRWQVAEEHFKEALRVNAVMGAASSLARTRHAYADALLARIEAEPWSDALAERQRALDLLGSALTAYQRLGMNTYRDKAVAAELRTLGPMSGGVGTADVALPLQPPGGDLADVLAADDSESLPVGTENEATGFPVQQWGTYRTLLNIRLGVCLTLCVVVPLGLLAAQGWPPSAWSMRTWPLVGLVGLTTLAGLAYRAAAQRRQRLAAPPPGVVYLIHWIDAALVTVAMFLLGGLDVFIGVPIYALILVHTAIEVPARRVHVLAGVAAAAYALTILGLDAGWEAIFARAELTEHELLHARTTLAIVNAIFLAVLSFLSTTLAGVTRRQTIRARAAEARLQALNSVLEQKVRERTLALNAANASLITTNIALEELNREIELYANAVSHDIRSHIVAATESLRLVSARAFDGTTRLCQLGMESLRGVERMLVSLRDLMRNRAGEPVRAVAMQALLGEVINEVRTVRDACDVPVELVGLFSEIEAQPSKIRHAFRNLIDNAVVHTRGRSGCRIEVGQKAEGGSAVFWVRDNGEGIPYDYQGLIFEPFRRGPNENEDGIGIGLTLVRQIVQQHGGKVWADSVPGKGATFWIKMPAHQSRSQEGKWALQA